MQDVRLLQTNPFLWGHDGVTLDPATLQDLEVFTTSAPGGVTVISLIDRTHSRIGREHLRRRLDHPARTPEEVARLQDAHRALIGVLSEVRIRLDRANLDAVTDYLESRWHVPTGRWWPRRAAEGLWLRLRYPSYLREVAAGQNRVLSLLDAARGLSQLVSAGESRRLQELVAELAQVLDHPDLRRMMRLGTRGSAVARLAFDQLARGQARDRLVAVVNALGELEALWSVAAATTEHGWCFPRVGNRLRITRLVHPFLGTAGVANDLDLDPATRVCFVTGPNMAGKSTFLKAVAVALLLAQIGCGVPAAAMEFTLVNTIFSSVQITDNIVAGESFYLAEVRRIRNLALALAHNGSALAVIDEPFRGTNVHDAAEASIAIITRLADQPAAITLIASHLGEIASRLAEDERVRCLHFAADVSVIPPRFDYQMREGVSEQRLGMLPLEQEGVLELLERPVATPAGAAG
jgi:DNA mismatch repair ATPase MutS